MGIRKYICRVSNSHLSRPSRLLVRCTTKVVNKNSRYRNSSFKKHLKFSCTNQIILKRNNCFKDSSKLFFFGIIFVSLFWLAARRSLPYCIYHTWQVDRCTQLTSNGNGQRLLGLFKNASPEDAFLLFLLLLLCFSRCLWHCPFV